MGKQDIFLLQGIFFYEDMGLDIGYGPEIGESVVMRESCQYGVFQAVISSYTDGQSGLAGMMMDQFGESQITEVIISDKIFSFTKQYQEREPIFYLFKKKDTNGVWKGEYKGEDVKEGLAHCIITSVNKEFFRPESMPCRKCGEKMNLTENAYRCKKCNSSLEIK